MPDIDVRIVNDNSDEIIRDLENSIPVVLEALGQAAEGFAVMKCPVDTGRLRNSITHATSTYSGKGDYTSKEGTFHDAKAKETPEENTVYIGTNVEYAPYVELGTVRTPAQAYLRPAVADHTDVYKQIIKKYLK